MPVLELLGRIASAAHGVSHGCNEGARRRALPPPWCAGVRRWIHWQQGKPDAAGRGRQGLSLSAA